MGTREDQTPFELLPEEILSDIFKRLDLRRVKNASLVCKWWNRIIFSDYNIKRFRFIVGTDTEKYCNTNPLNNFVLDLLNKSIHLSKPIKEFEERWQHELWQLIPQSQRQYRHMSWYPSEKPYSKLVNTGIRRENNINDAYHKHTARPSCGMLKRKDAHRELSDEYIPRPSKVAKKETYFLKFVPLLKTERLETLKVNFDNCDRKEKVLKLLADAIRHMPQLHSLELSDSWSGWNGTPSVKLHSKTVRNLCLIGYIPVTFDMPSLQSFEGSHVAINAYNEGIPFENLRHLKINRTYGYKFGQPVQRNIFHRLANLETLRCYNGVAEEQFVTICKTCTMLKELTINLMEGLRVSDASVLNHLSKLVHLRSLTFGKIKGPGTAEFDFKKFPNIEHLRVNQRPHFTDKARVMHLP